MTGSETKLPLFEAFPGLEAKLPVASIGAWPTPVTTHPKLAEALGVGALDIKRDDQSAEPYGGGKPRKLELFFGKARAEGRGTVVTFGGVGSHHAVATALYAKKLGMKAVLLLLPQPRTEEVRRVLLASHAAGAELVMAGRMKAARRLAQARGAAEPQGVLLIAAGGSEPLGNVGFVSAGVELAAQIRSGEVARPDVIYLALGTMGSAVGLDIGLVAAGMPIPIVAVRASSVPISHATKLERMHRETSAFLGRLAPGFPTVDYDAERLAIDGRFLGKGYAEPTLPGRQAIATAGEHGLHLEATYTAKAFAGLTAAARAGELTGKRVLFWHSHSGSALDVEGVDPKGLPAAFRGWVVPRAP